MDSVCSTFLTHNDTLITDGYCLLIKCPALLDHYKGSANMDLELEKLTALITGASRGIGKAITLSLAKEGCKLSVCARGEPDLIALTKDLTELHAEPNQESALIKAENVLATMADVTQPDQVNRVVEKTVNAFGGLDLLALCAGGSFGGDIGANTIEDWRKTFELNLFHSYSFIDKALPFLKKSPAPAILVVTSISGWKPTIHRAQYAAAKAAQIHMVQSLAQELGPAGIRINSIAPGSTMVTEGGWDEFSTNKPDEFQRFTATEFPFSRLAAPKEIADVCTFLLSKRASWIHGANIPVDGGQRLPSCR